MKPVHRPHTIQKHGKIREHIPYLLVVKKTTTGNELKKIQKVFSFFLKMRFEPTTHAFYSRVDLQDVLLIPQELTLLEKGFNTRYLM